MLKKWILLSAIAIWIATPTTAAHAAPKPPAAKGCALYGKTVTHGTQIDFQDRWGNTIRSYVCWNGVWLAVLKA